VFLFLGVLARRLAGRPPSRIAFLDHARGPETSQRVAVVNLYTDNAGVRTNVLNGQTVPVGFTLSRDYAIEWGPHAARVSSSPARRRPPGPNASVPER